MTDHRPPPAPVRATPAILTTAQQARQIAEDVRGTADSGLRDLAAQEKIALAQVYATLALADSIEGSGARVR